MALAERSRWRVLRVNILVKLQMAKSFMLLPMDTNTITIFLLYVSNKLVLIPTTEASIIPINHSLLLINIQCVCSM